MAVKKKTAGKKKASSSKKTSSKKTVAKKKPVTKKAKPKTTPSVSTEEEMRRIEEHLGKDTVVQKLAKDQPLTVETEEAEPDEDERSGVELSELDFDEDSEQDPSDVSSEDEDSEPEDQEDDDWSKTPESSEPESEPESEPDQDESDRDSDVSDSEEEEEDSGETPDENKDLLILYKKRCLNCAYLVGHKETYYEECHYMNGNSLCPASTTKIVVGVPVEKASRAIARAILSGDTRNVTRKINKLQDKDPLIIERVMKRVRERVAENDLSLPDDFSD